MFPGFLIFSGTWKMGHQKYWQILKKEVDLLTLKPQSINVLENAFSFLNLSSNVLDFQTGASLLHNDFHPKNILLYDGEFSGVIDWECSQFGEADFELGHLIHWCLYPPQPHINFKPFLRALFQASPCCVQVPYLALRLSIYQIEHDIQQLIWQGSQAENERIPRIINWLDGGMENLLRQLC